MNIKDLFESIRMDNGDVSLTQDAVEGRCFLTINIDYREIVAPFNQRQSKQTRSEEDALWDAKKVNPDIMQAFKEYETYKDGVESSAEAEIAQLTEAYQRMIFGILALSDKKMKQKWAELIAMVPNEFKKDR